MHIVVVHFHFRIDRKCRQTRVYDVAGDNCQKGGKAPRRYMLSVHLVFKVVQAEFVVLVGFDQLAAVALLTQEAIGGQLEYQVHFAAAELGLELALVEIGQHRRYEHSPSRQNGTQLAQERQLFGLDAYFFVCLTICRLYFSFNKTQMYNSIQFVFDIFMFKIYVSLSSCLPPTKHTSPLCTRTVVVRLVNVKKLFGT